MTIYCLYIKNSYREKLLNSSLKFILYHNSDKGFKGFEDIIQYLDSTMTFNLKIIIDISFSNSTCDIVL